MSTTDDPPPEIGEDIDLDGDFADDVVPATAAMSGDDAATVPVWVPPAAPLSSDAPPTVMVGPAAPVPPVVGAVALAPPVVVVPPVVVPDVGAAVVAPGQTVLGAGDDAPTMLPPGRRAQGSGLMTVPFSTAQRDVSGAVGGGPAVPPSEGRPSTSPAISGIAPATAAALAGLKPSSSSLSSSGGIAPATAQAIAGLKPSSPSPGVASSSSLSSSGGIAFPTPASTSPTSLPASSSASSRSLATEEVPRVRPRPATRSLTIARPAGPPSLITPTQFKLGAGIGVAAIVAVIALLAQLTRPPAEPDLPLVRLPLTATDCQRLTSHGKELHCEAIASSLHGLSAAEREARLEETRAIAAAGGFETVIFKDKGRVWRSLTVHVAPAATTGASREVSQ